MNEFEFSLLVRSFANDRVAQAAARPGLCRVWTKEAIRVARDFRTQHEAAFKMEAREVEIEPFLWHTFLRILSDETKYLCDGSGTARHQPFFGLEHDAPHLQNSTVDPIQYYDLDEES